MATTIVDQIVEEEDTCHLQVSFFDESTPPVAITPTSLTWTLTDRNGAVINDRSAVSITPNETVYVTLSGDDLALQTGEVGKVMRCLLISGTYNSDRGNNLTLNKEIRFYVENSFSI